MKGTLTYGITDCVLTAAEFSLVAGIVARLQERLCGATKQLSIYIHIDLVEHETRELSLILYCHSLVHIFSSGENISISHTEGSYPGESADKFLSQLVADLEVCETLGEEETLLYEFLKKSKLRLVA